MKFTVKRSRWYRGQGGVTSRLRQSDGTMCCLGFLGETCGISESAMLNKLMPEDVASYADRKKWPPGLIAVEVDGTRWRTDAANEMSMTNDSRALGDDEREAKLTELFKGLGIEVEFVP